MQQKGDTFREDLPLNVKNGMKVLKNKTIYTGTGKIENGYIRYSERISEVDDMRNFIPKDEDEIVEVDGAYVIPGFIDVHSHGGYSFDAMDASPEEIDQMVRQMTAKEGITSYFCTTMTQTYENIEKAMVNIKEAAEKNPVIQGIHLEGPFLASEYKGAMPEYLLRTADMPLLKHYQETAVGFIHYITVSPEVAGIPEHVKDITEMGIKVAIGHSGADYATSWKCIDAGAAAATHTFNAMRLFHQHEPAIMGAVLESDVYCEAICDGRHLHPGSVRFLLKMKGYDRVIAITDSIMAAGLPDGNYKLGVNDVIVEEGDAKLKDGTRAGSTLTTGQAFRNLMKFTGESPEKILPLLTENPATMLGLQNSIGFISEGRDADVLIMDSEFQIKETFVKGRRII